MSFFFYFLFLNHFKYDLGINYTLFAQIFKGGRVGSTAYLSTICLYLHKNNFNKKFNLVDMSTELASKRTQRERERERERKKIKRKY
ncbi:hypothetical protein BpHYR1_034212 [Brachionus plicatilis]|uniref:Uncharacterized protein n=1 Tax=Brachionus plicatilis TaxID=10195 RepID=A0A3M7SM85_BRAPC|nr:hypothetical protein BpHYR1_034212 [Brachionus plicatilis]